MTMRYPLLVPRILERARTIFPDKEIITRTESGVHRCNYRELAARVGRLANALKTLGLAPGDRVGTFAWNTNRHLEAYFAVPGMGAVIHTINIRLAADDLVHIINHAQDKALLIDPDLAPVIEALAPRLKSVQHYIIMSDAPTPATTLPGALGYETLLSRASERFDPAAVDEYAPAGLCYTSATTGLPKGVVYSHRALYLHAMGECMVDSVGFSERDTTLAIVPMFHANCWGFPYASAMVGASQVMAGARPDPPAICDLIEQHRVTVAAGVPTVWVGVLDYLESADQSYDFSSVRQIISGGSAMPVSVIKAYKERLGLEVVHAYGMTEAAPIVACNRRKSGLDSLSEAAQYQLAGSQGLPVAGLEMRLVDEKGDDLPWDGQQRGELLLRGPWLASEYYNDQRSADTFIDGWYHSGDIASVDAQGYVQIGDRVRDMVKSGGEWISSVDLETAIIAHPDVLEAAVIAIPHPVWQERPLACVVAREAARATLDKAQVLDFIQGQFARWWLPDDVVFLPEIPKTTVGKFDKKALRERFREHAAGGPAPANRQDSGTTQVFTGRDAGRRD